MVSYLVFSDNPSTYNIQGQGQSGLPAPGRRDKDNKKREASVS
jgi:hypothetical protein